MSRIHGIIFTNGFKYVQTSWKMHNVKFWINTYLTYVFKSFAQRRHYMRIPLNAWQMLETRPNALSPGTVCACRFFVITSKFSFQENYSYFVVPSGDAAHKFKIKRNSKGIWGLHFRRNPRTPGRYHLAIDGQRTTVDGHTERRKLPILHVKLIVSGNWNDDGARLRLSVCRHPANAEPFTNPSYDQSDLTNPVYILRSNASFFFYYYYHIFFFFIYNTHHCLSDVMWTRV